MEGSTEFNQEGTIIEDKIHVLSGVVPAKILVQVCTWVLVRTWLLDESSLLRYASVM